MPYQFLPTREGYVPVYIRMGDTPLNEINPELAVAFHEGFANGRQLKSDDGVKFLLTIHCNFTLSFPTKLLSFISLFSMLTTHRNKVKQPLQKHQNI